MNKKSTILIFISFIILVIAAVSFRSSIIDGITELKEKNLPQTFCDSGPVSCFYYNSLTNDQKRAYICIYNGIKNHREKIQIPKLSDGELSVVFEGVQFDNPDIFCVDEKGYVIKSSMDYYFQPQYIMDKEKCEACICQLEKISSYIKKETASMSEYEKELYIHDYIASVCTYKETDFDNTAYGCLVNKTAVCSGYSRGFMYLLDKAGVKCDVISGDAINKSGETTSHMWNIVNIDDENYIVDVTWDDVNTDENNSIMHMYFNLDYDSSLINHKPEKNIKDLHFGTKYNYIIQNNTSFDSYTEYDFNLLIDASVENVNRGINSIEFAFSNEAAYEYACDKLFNEDKNNDLSKLIYHINLKANKQVNFNFVNYINNNDFYYIKISFLEN